MMKERLHTTEEKLIGWTLINSYCTNAPQLAPQVNLKNLSVFGRIIFSEMQKVFAKHPNTDFGPRLMDAVFEHGVRGHKIPYAFAHACMNAADEWIPFGPTSQEIEEVTL